MITDLLALLASPLAIMGVGRVAGASTQKNHIPHKRSQVMPYLIGKPFVIAIEHPHYVPGSTPVTHATITNSSGQFATNWYPIYQTVEGHRVTVIFDTTGAQKPPVAAGSPGKWPPLPVKSLPLPGGSIDTNSVLCIYTNVDTDICPPANATPLLLDPLAVNA